MKSDKNLLYGQFILLIIFLLYFLKTGDPLTLFMILVALHCVLIYASKIRNHKDKYVFNILPLFFIIQSLILIYTYLFKSTYLIDLNRVILFYFFCVVLIATIAIYIYFYHHREKYTSIS